MFSAFSETPAGGSKPAGQEQGDAWQQEVFDSIDQYAQNLNKKEALGASVQQEIEEREKRREAIDGLFAQVARHQDIVNFEGQPWRAKVAKNGDIALSATTLKDSAQLILHGQAQQVPTENNFEASKEVQRQELEKLWQANQQIEKSFGGAEQFVRIQKKVEGVKAIDQQLALERSLEEAVAVAKNRLSGVDNYAGVFESGHLRSDFQEQQIRDKQRYAEALLIAEGKLGTFRKNEKPKLIAQKEIFLAELQRLVGKE